MHHATGRAQVVGATQAMASAWATTSYPKNDDFTVTWTITDFDKALKIERKDFGLEVHGELTSPQFNIPGIPWRVSLCVRTDDVDRHFAEDVDDDYYGGMPSEVLVGEERVRTPIIQYFKIMLNEEWREEWEEERFGSTADEFGLAKSELMAGYVKITSEDNDFTMSGKFGDTKKHEFVKNIDIRRRKRMCRYGQDTYNPETNQNWVFKSDTDAEINLDHANRVKAKHFYTVNPTNSMTIEATFSVPGQLKTVGGAPEARINHRLPFGNLLTEPEFADFRLMCGGKEFQVHKVILANR